MMNYLIKAVVFFWASTCVLVLSSQAQGKTPLNGTWNFSVETSAGNGNPVFELKHDNDSTVSGTYRGALGESAVSGTLKGKDVYLSFSVNGNLVEYRGILDGKNIKGTVKLGTMAEGTFSAVKKE